MKIYTLLFTAMLLTMLCHAQITVDKGYAVGSIDSAKVAVLPSLLGNLKNMVIRENSSGKTCMPVDMQCTFVTPAGVLKTTLAKAAEYMDRLRPGDRIVCENIVLAKGCFAPPKEVVITLQ